MFTNTNTERFSEVQYEIESINNQITYSTEMALEAMKSPENEWAAKEYYTVISYLQNSLRELEAIDFMNLNIE